MAKWKKISEGWKVNDDTQYSINPDPMTDQHKEGGRITVFGDKLADAVVEALNKADVTIED